MLSRSKTLITSYTQRVVEKTKEDIPFFKEYMKEVEVTNTCEQKSIALGEEGWNDLNKNHTTFLLNITKKCNSACKICYVKDMKIPDMDLNDIKFVMSKIGKKKKVILTGGEPTTRDDLFEIIDIVKKSGNIPYIYTNGLKLSDKSYAMRIKNSGVKYVLFSFDGFSPKTQEKIRGDTKQLETKLEALKNLKEIKIKTQLSSIIVAGLNDMEIPNILSFAISNNDFIKSLTFVCATPLGRFEVDIDDFLTPLDIIRKLSAYNPEIREEYFIQLKIFYDNIGNLLGRLGKQKANRKLVPEAIYSVTDGKLNEIIDLQDLRDVNKSFEDGRMRGLIKFIWKYRKLFFMFLVSGLNVVKFEEKISEQNILHTIATFVSTPIKSERRVDTIGITKKREGFVKYGLPC